MILEFTTPRRPLVRTLYHFYFHHVLPLIGGWSAGIDRYEYLPDPWRTFRRKRTRRANERGGVRPTSGGRRWLGHRGDPPVAKALNTLSLDTLARIRRQLDAAASSCGPTAGVADLELCEIADRVMKQPGGGPALLFEHRC